MYASLSRCVRDNTMQQQYIKDFYGKVIARIDFLPDGNKRLYNFYGKLLGEYVASRDVTCDFYGKLVGHGDCLTMLISK